MTGLITDIPIWTDAPYKSGWFTLRKGQTEGWDEEVVILSAERGRRPNQFLYNMCRLSELTVDRLNNMKRVLKQVVHSPAPCAPELGGS